MWDFQVVLGEDAAAAMAALETTQRFDIADAAEPEAEPVDPTQTNM